MDMAVIFRLHLLAFAQHTRKIAQGLREVAARLALDGDDNREEICLGDRDPLRHPLDAFRQGHSDRERLDNSSKLRLHRLGAFGRGYPDRIAKGKAGFDAAHDDIDGGRKVGDELVDAPNAQARQRELRQPDRGCHDNEKREQQASRLNIGQGAANQAKEHAPDPILLFGDRESGLFDFCRQTDAPPLSLHFTVADAVGDLLLARRSIDASRHTRLRVGFRDRRAPLVGSRVPADEGKRQTAESKRKTGRDRYRIDHADHPPFTNARLR